MEDFISRRLLDLAQQSDRTARFTFSDFLTEAEFAAFSAIRSQLPDVGWTAFGGYPQADRVMLRFGNPELLGYEEPFPIVCIQIAPVQEKFAENLSHRDFLGAVMHLGIQRSGAGDILVQEKHAYLFCRDALADYICGSLERIRHTSVRCTVTESLPEFAAPKTERVTVQAASERADLVIAKLFHISRSDCSALFAQELVFLDGAVLQSSSHMLREGDKISVRGHGKFRYLGITGKTKKGNLILAAERFV